MTTDKLQLCNQQCLSILSLDKNNNDATLVGVRDADVTSEREQVAQMIADLMYQRNEGEQALKYFATLLERDPSECYKQTKALSLVLR